MATPSKQAKIDVRKEKMDLVSCLMINGEYDLKEGVCVYKVKINENGEEEYIGKEGE